MESKKKSGVRDEEKCEKENTLVWSVELGFLWKTGKPIYNISIS